MSDVLDIADGLMGQQKAARVDALQGLTEDPEQAARALELGNATGENPAAIYGNVEEFEQNHRAALTNELLKNNHHLIDYANSHPLASKVSADDWGQLDAVSEKLKKVSAFPLIGQGIKDYPLDVWTILKEGIAAGVQAPSHMGNIETVSSKVGRVIEQFEKEGVTQDSVKGAVDAILPMVYAAATPGGMVLPTNVGAEELAGAVMQVMASPIFGGIRAFVSRPLEEGTGIKKELSESVINTLMMAAPYLKAGKRPPHGMAPEIDKMYADEAKIDVKDLDDALKEAQSSQTRERSPEMFKEFVKQQVGERTIGISADAIKRIYGDKEPLPEDNILGWVPNIGEQLRVAAEFGGDVEVPLADWLAKVDPEVAKELHDSIRVRGNGVTLEEAKAPKTLAAEKEPKAPEFATPEDALGLPREPPRSTLTDQFGPMEWGPPSFETRAEAQKWASEVLQTVPWYVQDNPGGGFRIMAQRSASTESGFNRLQQFLGPVRSVRSAAKLDSLEEPFKPQGGFSLKEPLDVKVWVDNKEANESFKPVGSTTLGNSLAELDLNKIGGPLSPFLDAIRDRLTKTESNVPVHVTSLDKMKELGYGGAHAIYDPINHQILIAEDTFRTPDVNRVLVHEGIHAATARLIDSDAAARDVVRSIMNEVERVDGHLRSEYGFTNEHEFLTEALTKDHFQRALLRTKISPELAKALGLKEWRSANAWQAMVQWIRQLFKLPEEHSTALEATLRVFDVLSEKDLLPEEREVYKQFQSYASKREPELPGMTRMEDRQVFEEAKAIGMNVAQYKRYQELIAQRAKEDAEFAKSQALKDEERRQSKEWKENENKMWDEVVPEMEARPDFAADAFLREGRLYGDKLKGRPRLDWESLTPEERAMLPPDFVTKKGGMSPDDVAGLFGYDSGKTLLDHLTRMEADRRNSGLGPKQQFNKVVEAEVERRMQARFGDLGENILKAAQEHVVSQTQLDLLAEEVIHLGTLAGSELPIKKDELKAWAKGAFGKQQAGGVSLEKLLRTAGNNGKQAELFLLEDKPREAFQWKQRQYLTMLLADEAKRFEKRMDQFDRVAKQFSKREVPSVEPEYTNFIHDILMRVGKPVRRSVQDLQNSIAGSGHASLEEFVQSKEANFRELPVAEFLYDPAFRKPVEEMTVDEFSAMHDSIKTLVKNGRDELKIIKAGDEADLNIIKARMIEQLGTFAEKHYDAVGKRWLGPFPPAIARPIRTYLASHLQLEGLFNRWDRGDPRGVFTQWIMRDLASAANTEAALERRFARLLSEIGDKRADLEKGVPNSIFMDPHSLDSPDGPLPMVMKRKNLRAILQNVGNESNLDKLARGYQVDPKAIMNWLNQHATKADWDWAQRQGDIFKQIKEEADVMYRHLTGVEPEGIDIKPIDTPHGTYPGWYHPIVYHPVWEGRSRKLMGGDVLEQDNYVRATTPRGYTKQRTGYAAPLNLDLDATPGRMRQMIHDIAMRPAVINAGKIFYDKDVRQAITKHYGKEYRDLLVPYLRDVANSANFRSDAASVGAQVSEFFRQNIIATLIGFNPGTVLKHGPTAAINSLTEVGAKEFSKALTSLFSINDRTGETNWRFAMDTSEELQRRHRHYVETLKGAQETAIGAPTMRDTVIKLGAYPVAMSDLLSAVPTWLAKYESSMRETGVHGDAIYEADRAVRRAHGSSVVTNRPEVMRTGPMGAWFASLYGFFSHILNRQYELGWRAKDALGLVKEGEVAAAAKEFPKLAGMFFSYIIAPALIEELVTPMTNDEKESWAKKAAKTVGFGLSSSWIGLRDIVHAAATGHDPSAGLISTAYKTVTDLTREVSRGETALNRDHAGKLIRTGTIAFGALTGLANAQVGKSSEFIYNYSTGRERPKGPWQWGIGLRYGQTKGHTKSFEEWQHHVGKEWFGGKI